MSDNAETVPSSEVKTDETSSTPLFGQMNTPTSARLFGQFKQHGTGFGAFSQSSTNGTTSSPPTGSYFTSTVSKLSSNQNGGFGSSGSSLAASLASLSDNKQLFGGSSANTSSSFTDVKTVKDEEDGEGEPENGADEDDQHAPSLLENVAEYEAKRATTHLMANIQGDTSTGEEHEVTKFQMTGKLYMYNPEQQQFVERGYGTLKINESQEGSERNNLQARLIMRLDKAFRVILNSPIFPRMTVARATDRSVRFGAQDDSTLRIFIIKASTSDCANLCQELQSRIQIIERQQATVNDKDAACSSDSSRLPKRSHSKSDSDTSDHTSDLSKKSKLIEGYRDGNVNSSDDDSVESVKTGEQESTG